jgi:16S rRNA (guanine(527)-N(7))-methyltransferase RsmG
MHAVSDSIKYAIAAGEWTGHKPSSHQLDLLRAYRDWLVAEAIPAGGVGPNETSRIWRRHVADSLLFGYGLKDQPLCLDIGSGVGLPGIPLAITHPQTRVDLVDKSGRRCDLLRRAVGVLGLDNCTVVHRDVTKIDRRYPFIVSRAAIPADRLMIHVKQLLDRNGVANISIARGCEAMPKPKTPAGLVAMMLVVPDQILDTRVQLLRIEEIQTGS